MIGIEKKKLLESNWVKQSKENRFQEHLNGVPQDHKTGEAYIGKNLRV